MKKMYTLLIALTMLAAQSGYGDSERIDKLFKRLSRAPGNFHQATMLVQATPQGEPIDMEDHQPANTLSVHKVSEDMFVFNAFTKEEEASNTAVTVVLKRKAGKMTLTRYDLVNPINSFKVEPTVSNSSGTELSFYQSDVTYIDNSELAVAQRKKALEERQLALAGLVLVLTLKGIHVPAEVIGNDDWMTVYFTGDDLDSPIGSSEIFLDPEGVSRRKPKGEPSLTLIKVFHTGQNE